MLRQEKINTHGVVLRALGGLGKAADGSLSRRMGKQARSANRDLDWRKSVGNKVNPEWENVCITAGSVLSNRQARVATLAVLKDKVGVGLDGPGNAIQKQARRRWRGVIGDDNTDGQLQAVRPIAEGRKRNRSRRRLLKRRYYNDDSDLWQPFGGFGMNLNQINNQQSDATAALVEKLINSIDAVLMAECYRGGDRPERADCASHDGRGRRTLFKVKDGRLKTLLASGTHQTRRDAFTSSPPARKRSRAIWSWTRAKGQTPDSFKDTFLSLTKQNKDDIPFVQGRFNCGGTGVLPFCGEHKYQLIVSRRHPSCPAAADDATKGPVGIHIGSPSEGRTWPEILDVCLPGARGKILTFDAPNILVLPGQSARTNPHRPIRSLYHGTCIKLYNYRWKRKTIGTTEGRFELERYLHSVSLPVPHLRNARLQGQLLQHYPLRHFGAR